MIKLVVGLGNPGKKYELTRHNIGRMVLEHLPFSKDLNWTKKFKGLYSSYMIDDNQVHFLLPETYMNLSGESIQPCAAFFKINVDEILIAHDELDVEFGKIVFKKGGGFAGHNGLKSAAQVLASDQFLRMRIGISRPQFGDVSNWVLNPFSTEENAVLEDYLKASAKALQFCIKNGIDKSFNKYNKKNYSEILKMD